MIEGLGLFKLAARSTTYDSIARLTASGHRVTGGVFMRNDKPSGFGATSLNNLTVDANTTIRAMFQQAWDKVHEDDKFISDDMIKRLEDASKSDNKEIAAEKLRQAKAKLRSLRLQAQMAAASGDPKQLKRIAQQAAAAAREVASAARGLAEGIASSATPSDGSASAAMPMAAQGGATEATTQDPAAAVQPAPEASGTTAPVIPTQMSATGMSPTAISNDDAREALRKLGDETRAAIAQARGIIAFAAQAARQKRRNGEPDDDFRQLQQSVNEAERDLNSALNDATTALNGGGMPAVEGGAESGLATGIDSVAAVQTTTIAVQVSVEVSFTANIVI